MSKPHNIEGYTVAQAAIEADISTSRVRQLVAAKEVESEKFGNIVIITPKGLKQLKARKTKPGPATTAKNGRRKAA